MLTDFDGDHVDVTILFRHAGPAFQPVDLDWLSLCSAESRWDLRERGEDGPLMRSP